VPGGRPQPDVALARHAGPRQHPKTPELVVEVAVSSLNDDLAKLPGYAEPA
jgi:Uma2 family endonuclease